MGPGKVYSSSIFLGDPPASGTPQSNSIPRTYIHCTLGPLSSWMEPFAVRARKLGWNVHPMAVVHDVMITHPNKLAEILQIAISEIILICTSLLERQSTSLRFLHSGHLGVYNSN